MTDAVSRLANNTDPAAPLKLIEILQIAEHYKARVVDFGATAFVLQAYGSSEKLDALIELLRPFEVVELVRSGKLLMARGESTT